MQYLIGAVILFFVIGAVYSFVKRFFWYIVGFFAILLVGILAIVISNRKKQKQQEAAKQEATAKAKQESELQKKERQEKWEQAKAARDEFLENKKAEFDSELEAIPKVPVQVSEQEVSRQRLSDIPDIAPMNITRRTPIDKIFPLVVIDVETTGLQPSSHDIIEVTAIKYDIGFTPKSCFTTLCKPRKPIPPEASNVNHITDEMVANAPEFGYIAEAFSEFISGCTIVGHNVDFDLRFLHASGTVISEKVRCYDTLDLAKLVINREEVYNYKLDTLCRYYGIYRSTAHRSLSDCFATGKLFKAIVEDKVG